MFVMVMTVYSLQTQAWLFIIIAKFSNGFLRAYCVMCMLSAESAVTRNFFLNLRCSLVTSEVREEVFRKYYNVNSMTLCLFNT